MWPRPRLRRAVISMSSPRRCVVISGASPSSWPSPTSGSREGSRSTTDASPDWRGRASASRRASGQWRRAARPAVAHGRSLRPSVSLHDLAERGAQVVARAPQVWMNGEGAPKEQGRFVELAQHQMAEALARECPEVVGIAGEGLSAIRNGGGGVLGHVGDGGSLVSFLRKGRGRPHEAGGGRPPPPPAPPATS